MIYISLIFLYSILSFITCKNYLPRFESLPPPLVYYAENSEESSRILTCKAWPPSTEIKLYSTKRVINSDTNNPSQSQYLATAPLHPLDSEHVEGSSVVVRNVAQARVLSKLDLHCLAQTKFGAVISRPFRVVEARIGPFTLTKNAGEAHKIIKHFMHSNVAYVDCDPPLSFPPAVIEFKLNDTTINRSRRYKYIKRPNSQRVTLLILAFEPRDEGYYRCIATNTVTGETKTDPLVQQLKIKSPVRNVPVSVKMTISGKEVVNLGAPMDIITVREGMNVTLFCVMEGAPPPSVTTFKMRGSANSQPRHVSDKEFGLLSITKVSVEDEDSYQCSEMGVTDTAQLKVQKRLSITQGPLDIRVSELNTQARFTCLSNDNSITPQWYFNGRIRNQAIQAGRDSSLHIAVVRKEDLGVYQCVVRSQDEWVTEVASLSLKSEELVSKDDDGDGESSGGSRESSNIRGEVRRARIKKNVIAAPVVTNDTRTQSRSPLSKLSPQLPPIIEELPAPDVYTIADNLAVLLSWKHKDSANGVIRHYRVQYKSRRGDTVDWSPIQTLDNEIIERYFYVTSRHLQAQHLYIFRISFVMITGISQNSEWSRSVSFSHVYPVQPTILTLQLFNKTYVRVQWQYSQVLRYPVSEYRVLVRRSVQDGSRINYSRYWIFVVPDVSSTETIVGSLLPGNRYQVIVYGVKDSTPRMITLYSAETTVEIPQTDISPTGQWPIKNNTESNTKLMFVILGSLAGLMVLVIVVLVLMCYCRERRSCSGNGTANGHHRNNRYKDPAKMIHSSEQSKAVQSSFLLASISAAALNSNKLQQDGNNNSGPGGEHASLLSTVADNVYYQQKRQPPSGGSGHDMSDGEGVSVQDALSTMRSVDATNGGGHQVHQGGAGGSVHMMQSNNGMLTPQPPAITYFKAVPGPASLPAGSLIRQSHQQQQFSPQQRYSPGYPQYGPPQVLYTNAGMVYSPGTYLGTMYPGQQVPSQQQQQQQQIIPGTQRQDLCDMRSQDGGESVYSYFSQTSNNNNAQRHCPGGGPGGLQGTVETGSQTINSTGSAGHRHHRRKRRKTNNSSGGGGAMMGMGDGTVDMCGTQPKIGMRAMYPGNGMMHGQREVMYDTPPSNHPDPRMINVPPGMVLMQPGMVNGEQCWGQMNNTLTRRGTPTLFVEPPRIRDYSEYGIPHNQMMMVAGAGQQPQQQLAHLSQQNLHLHNQNLSGGYRDAQA